MRAFTQNPSHPQKQASPALARSNMATHKSNQRGNPLPQLQRTLGNQAMQRMLQTHDEEPNAGLTAAVSPRVGHDISQILKHPHAPEAIQTKLAISKPGDEYEQEADRVAEQVMRMPEPTVQRKCAACGAGGGPCPKREAEQSGLLHRKADAASGRSASSDAAGLISRLGSGQPLDAGSRAFFESRLGHDFSHVRVHSGTAAEQSARDVNANAYAVGHNVVFGTGRFAPGTHEGRRLIAHELAHVIQQGSMISHRIQRDMVPDRNGELVFQTREEAQRRLNNMIRLIPDSGREGNFFLEWRWNPTNPVEDPWQRGTRSRSREETEVRRDQLMRIIGEEGRWFVEKDTSLRPEESADSSPSATEDSPSPETPDADTSTSSDTPSTGSAAGGATRSAVTCRRFQTQTQTIIDTNPRNYARGVTMERRVIGRGDNFSSLAEDTVANNTVTLTPQLAIELTMLNTHIRPTDMRPGDCVLVLRGWSHPNIGTLPPGVIATTSVGALPTAVKEAIATVYSEQWNTGINSQEQQRYIWFSMRMRIGTSLRGPNISSVLDRGEYHGIGQPLYNNALAELNAGTISTSGVENAKDAVISNFANSVPMDAGIFYFHWTGTSTSEGCFNRTKTRMEGSGPSRRNLTADEILNIERSCAKVWAVRQGWDANLGTASGWHKRIRSDSNSRIGSMYVYKGF